jgi:hypothetical protein
MWGEPAMSLDAELDGANGVNSDQTAVVARSTQQSPRLTRRVSVRLSEQIFQQLEAASGCRGVDKSTVVEAALERFLDPAPPIEGLVHEALAQITSHLKRLDGDVRSIAETVALHARYHLTVTPPVPQPQQREACALGEERFKAFCGQVDSRVRLGRPLMRETIDRVNASKADTSQVDDASLVSADHDHEAPTAHFKDTTADLIAAVGEDGSNRHFRHLPNAFC